LVKIVDCRWPRSLSVFVYLNEPFERPLPGAVFGGGTVGVLAFGTGTAFAMAFAI